MDKNKMLIDATHPEETRVVVLRNGRVEEFDYESASRKLLRGNIYLAKVTRVEPSLQAAFVEYGGNRHGFLAFSEIHPDYYQIPIADRELLKQEEAEAEAAAEAEADERARQRDRRRRRGGEGRDGEGLDREGRRERTGRDAAESFEAGPDQAFETIAGHDAEPRRDEALEHDHHPQDRIAHDPGAHDHADGGHSQNEPRHDAAHQAADSSVVGHDHTRHDAPEASDHDDRGNVEDIDAADSDGGADNGANDADQVEQVAAGVDALEELPERPRRRARQYKIQEVIKRRQIILVQVVKEERGNKGAALTTYISLAGRYTVLMPNTGRGGGISRKITQPQDRKRLKAIAEDLEVGEGMGLIIRTAGAAQSKQEIKRDYEYLLRLWESVRDMTLSSTAPCLVYEEGNLIKRSIRDLYSKEFDDIQVAGAAAHVEARDFMGMLMPGHADSVVKYEGPEPLFTRFGIERQLNAMFNPVVTLRSGGYIVINQTEALVAVDVNSGKSTREFSIEETALNTNIEAAEEIARQLKLRDLAGLIVVDFIDMEEKRNNRTVERRMKDALRHDRARIQVGRISHFGLLEMSRQRLRTGVVEGSTSQCPHCLGTGNIRSTESIALAVLRGIEDNLMKQPSSLAVTTNASVALYILNNKRQFITEIEQRLGIAITVEASDRMHGANFAIERTAAAPEHVKAVPRTAVSMDWGFDAAEPEAADEADVPAEREPVREHHNGRDRDSHDRGGREHREPREGRDEPRGQDEVRADGEDGGRNRRRRRRRGRRDQGGEDRGPMQGEAGHTASGHGETSLPDSGAGLAVSGHSHDGHDHGSDLHGRDLGPDRGPDHGPDHGVEEIDGRAVHFAAGREGPVREEISGEDSGHDSGPGDRNAADSEENRQKRGRRRGRRGGRARGREDTPYRGDRQPDTEAVGHTDSADWGLLDVAKPGAEQPVGKPVTAGRGAAGNDHHRSIVTVAEPIDGAPRHEPEPAARVSIVETVPMPAYEPAPVAPPDAAAREFPAAATVRIVETVVEPVRYEPAPYVAPAVVPVEAMPAAPASGSEAKAGGPVRKGWWQRRFGSE